MALLKKRGDMNSDGSLTTKGESRNCMTAKERAIDRAGGTGTYDAATNTVKQ